MLSPARASVKSCNRPPVTKKRLELNLDQTRLESSMEIVRHRGLLDGPRTRVVRARMPQELVAAAKKKTGLKSDSRLLEIALANIVAADDYVEWLHSQRGTVDPSLDLEF